jgi:branched-chain amino acid transport system substrate-binding protein
MSAARTVFAAPRLALIAPTAVSVVLAAVAAVALGGCGSQGTASETELAPGATVKIGYLASLTGFCAKFARQYVQGAELAVRRIDAGGGVDGHRLQLVVRNDKATPSIAVELAQGLVQDEHVRFLAGACTSAVGKDVAQSVANPDHVLYAAGITDPTAFAGGPQIYAFDTLPTTTSEGRLAAAYVRAHPQWRRIAVVSEDYEYGYRVTAAFERALADQTGEEEQAGQRVVSRQFLPAGGANFRPYIRALLASRPDVVVSTAIEEDAQTLVSQGLPLGLFAGARVLGVMDYGVLATMPEPPLGIEGYTIYPSAAIYDTPYARALEALGPSVANGGAAGDAFNQIELIAQGIAKARSTDPAKVRDALNGASVETVQGDVRVRACDHQLKMPIAMGPVVGPSAAQPFPHLAPVSLMGTGGQSACGSDG